ncbi:MAG: type II secretion system protein [Magnetococcales bacterium]|nr:type II secretion system protein [Magnetococcales bacterium]
MSTKATAKPSGGFTLIEMAIALTILGVVMIGGFDAMRSQMTKRRMEQTQISMQEIQQALLGFITVNGRLPCAAVDQANPTGVEECSPVTESGLLPWVTLGVKPADPWGRTYRYYVTSAFTSSFATDAVAPLGDLTVRNFSDTADIALQVPVLIISYGRNGQSDAKIDTAEYRLGSDDILLWVPTDVLKYQKIRS